MLSQESEAPFNASDKSFVRVFLQFQLLKQSIVCPNRFTQLVSDGRQDKNIIHVAQIKPVGSGQDEIHSVQKDSGKGDAFIYRLVFSSPVVE
jgi:hypothetical protein